MNQLARVLSAARPVLRPTLTRSMATTTGRLEGEVAIITGGSAGIGKETAIRFAEENIKGMVIADVNEKEGLEVTNLIKDMGVAATFVKVDVSNPKEVEEMVKIAEKEYGKLSVLFNNAGIMHPKDDTAVTTTDDVWDKTFDVNVKGVWYGCKYGIPALLRNGGGSIINTGSFVGKMGAATPQLAYTCSKGAVLAMTRELAVLHARQGIRVNSMCPGPLRTELLMKFLDTDEKKHRRLVHLPMGRFGEAREMADAVVFLASKESSYITGTDFMVDGGLTAAYVTPE